ncbi:MAG TPA: hypothetical protein VFW09_13625 [Solirubrobacteraceae bacterium]|jgi:hypothetical protein|nr:hypothetical protein [Solirubrobacteraceae bacterium]
MPNSTNQTGSSGPRVLRPLADIGSRAAATTLRPLSGMIDAAADAGIGLERRAVDRVLESDEVERVLIAVINSTRMQLALQRALASDGARRLVDTVFDSGLVDRLLERLLASDSLWHVIDEIAGSPAIAAAVSQQGLGFADQVGDEVRERSRKADDWVERAARRLTHRPPRVAPAGPDVGM